MSPERDNAVAQNYYFDTSTMKLFPRPEEYISQNGGLLLAALQLPAFQRNNHCDHEIRYRSFTRC